jgi:two-component system sensor histidine kinase PhoQ
MASIHSRLLLAAMLVLAAFLGLGAVALDRAFQRSVESAVNQQLMGYVYALLGAAETDSRGRIRLPEALPDPRFSNPDSGLYAQVMGRRASYQWHSPSHLGRRLDLVREVEPGQRLFAHRSVDGNGYYQLNFGLTWEDDEGNELFYSFAVAEEDDGVRAQVTAFRETLLIWLGGAALLLLAVQGIVLRWGLDPLRRVSEDLKRIEQGKTDRLEGNYPGELAPLTSNINSLIRTSRVSQERYRNSLGDLAHSLKTPLAVLQGVVDSEDPSRIREVLEEQVPRMNEIVQYQLKRAATRGRQSLSGKVQVSGVVERLIRTLDKVYRDRGIECCSGVGEDIHFAGDSDDLMEVVGNLLENAYKYGRSSVQIRSWSEEDRTAGGGWFHLVIEDDGPGIDAHQRERVLARGYRADESQKGQGIGLGVAHEIIRLYDGVLEIGTADLGGARLDVRLPE